MLRMRKNCIKISKRSIEADFSTVEITVGDGVAHLGLMERVIKYIIAS